MRNKNDNVLIGVGIGICLPVLIYALFMYLDEAIEAQNYMIGPEPFEGFDNVYKPFAIVSNLIPFHYFSRKNMLNAMRGVVLPTIILVVVWAYTMRNIIF